jgi:type III pantothenate kinase
MSTFLVADVGNSRIKWGLCTADELVGIASLPLDSPAAWDEQFARWECSRIAACVVAGVNPDATRRLLEWLTARGEQAVHIVTNKLLPLRVQVDFPEQVGVDRLLNAVAFNHAREENEAGIIVDAGSAVTVDLVDEVGIFRGGAIFPGLRLMAQALRTYTAKLPMVHWDEPPGSMPGPNTSAAIACGIHAAVVGGILRLVDQLTAATSKPPSCWLTGGDGSLLRDFLPDSWKHWSVMTLEGLRLTALRLL